MLSDPKSNTFDMSHDRKFSMDMGRLVPCYLQEIVPGDRVTMQTEQMIRFAPMVAPMMHNVDVFTHFFFVPNRILWANWRDFITGGEDGTANPGFPTCEANNLAIGTYGDYLGIPTQVNNPVVVSALPVAGLCKIWDEYYRDQNLQPTKLFQPLVDFDNDYYDSILTTNPFNRAWEHDYFTSALPTTQKGPEVDLPLGTTAPLVYTSGQSRVRDLTGDIWENAGDLLNDGDANVTSGSVAVGIDVTPNTVVDLTSATSASINDLRFAIKLQEYYERLNRGGSRYNEYIKSMFGVNSSDARLQRPEYLGGGKTPVSVSEVVQTSNSFADNTPQGNLSGHGVSLGQGWQFSRSFEEHGYIIGFISVMPKPAYSQGLHRHFKRFNRLDYLIPTFSNLGEQPIYNYELYMQGTADDNLTFGYTPRYAEYRFMNGSVHGDFRDTLSYWHMARDFNALPLLNSSFISCVPTDRIFAVQDLPDDGGESGNPIRNFHKLYCHMYHKIMCSRKLPVFGVPSI